MITKVCQRCKEEKELHENFRFYNNYWTSYCKKCLIEMHRQYNRKNRDLINQKRKERYRIPEVREKILGYGRKYRKEHKEEKAIKDKEYRMSAKAKKIRANGERKRKQNDKVYYLKCYVRNMIGYCLKYKDAKKCKKTEEITKLEIEKLKEYLLKTFEIRYGYEWDGKEQVDIDHIKPLILANTEQEVMELCNYKNLQLLKRKDNIEKNTSTNWNG